MRCHKRAKSMLCDLSLLDTAVDIGNTNATVHKRSKSTQFTFASSAFALAAPASPSTFTVVDRMPKGSAMITPVSSPHTHSKRARLCLATSESTGYLEDLHPCSPPPPLVVYRPVVTLQRVTQNGFLELPRHLLMPSLEDLGDDDNVNPPMTLLPRPRGPQSYIARRMPWRLQPDSLTEEDEDAEVASITARFHEAGAMFAPRF
jgi:hypothetical protein